MTSRLKRKLGDLGIDPSSSKANESFCLIGTPLPPLEKSKDTGEFVPLWKQEVRDEKGRRRLHGAFTGGFSAGYFNTVGSKEGWTPSTFVSSRADRSKKKAFRPEDFMDEEDLQELKDSRQIVDTTDEMDFMGGTKAELQRKGAEDDTDSLTAALQNALLPPTKDSAGARILKKMGWRLGQGIGPRVTHRQRALQNYDPTLTRGAPDDDDDEEAKKHTYARKDTPILTVERKDNNHGLGYRPGMSLNETLGVRGSSGASASGPQLSAGFGLGALNDADEDDLDVYDQGLSSRVRNKTAYDIAGDHDADEVRIAGRQRKRSSDIGSASATASLATFRDGTIVLPGFVLSDKPVAEDRWFPIPDIPKGWTPDPKRVWNQSQGQGQASTKDKENVQIGESGPVPHHKWKSSGMSADERGTILGETPLPSAPRSVFDFMSQKDRERLKNIAAGLKPSSEPSSAPAPSPSVPAEIRIPRTEPQIASAALKGFRPFPTNPVKQARYTAYLHSQADLSATTMLAPLPGQSIDEFNNEMEEYAQSALIFKPMTGAMAGRFTSAAIVDHGPKIYEGLHKPSVEEEKAAEERRKEKEEEEKEAKLSPKENAARLGMYGPLTREVKSWQPARLLCKRFGLKDPNPMPDSASTSGNQGAGATAPNTSAGQQFDGAAGSEADTVGNDLMSIASASFTQPTGGGKGGGKRDLSNIGLGEDETQGRDTLTYERPSVDVFKAIFASDDEESDDDDEKEEEEAGAVQVPGAGAKAIEEKDRTKEEGVKDAAPAANGTESEVVDPSTFKPTFVPREARKTTGTGMGDTGVKEKKKKKEKRKVLVSFAMDEGGEGWGDGEGEGGEGARDNVEKPKKKRKKDKDREKDKDKDKDRTKRRESKKNKEDEDDDMWVEKPVPASVRHLDRDVEMVPASTDADVEGEDEFSVSGLPKGRKRAIDFM